MQALLSWFRHLWMVMGLRGHLVAGYTALFAVLLVGIALGETTVVRQVLIEDRKAALPRTTNDLVSGLKGPIGTTNGLVPGLKGPDGAARRGFAGSVRFVSSDAGLVVALFAPNGTVLYQQVGAGVGHLDPKQLLDPHQAGSTTGGEPSAPTTYQR